MLTTIFFPPEPPDNIVREIIDLSTDWWSTKHAVLRPYFEDRLRVRYSRIQAWEFAPPIVLPQGKEGTAADGGAAVSSMCLDMPIVARLTAAMFKEIQIVCGLPPHGMPLHRQGAVAQCFQNNVNWTVQRELNVLRLLGRTAFDTLTATELDTWQHLVTPQQYIDAAGADPLKRIFTHVFVAYIKSLYDSHAFYLLNSYAMLYGDTLVWSQVDFVRDIVQLFLAEEDALDANKTLDHRRRDVL